MHPAFERRTLGRTGVPVSRMGMASSYGIGAANLHRAFEHGVNYFCWGSRRTETFGQGLRELRSQRDRLFFVVQSYSRMTSLIGPSLERALRKVQFEYADALLLGLWNRPAWPRIIEAAQRLKERGLVRFLALSTHKRPLIPQLAGDSRFDVFHLRYNAAHTGAEREVFPHLPEQGCPGIVSFTATSWAQLLDRRLTPPGEKTPTAVDCYRFVLSQPRVDVCLSGPANSEQAAAELQVLNLGPMQEDELAWMRRVGAAVYKNTKPRFP